METRIKKKIGISVLAMVMCLVIAAGTTLAYLFAESANKPVNVFTAGKLDIDLTEKPEWCNDEPGKNFVPGDYDKSPYVSNLLGSSANAFVALKITLTDGQGNALAVNEFEKFAALDNIGQEWAFYRSNDDMAIYAIYDMIVPPNAMTHNAFKNVVIKNPHELSTPNDTSLYKDFNMKIEAFAVTAEQDSGYTGGSWNAYNAFQYVSGLLNNAPGWDFHTNLTSTTFPVI